MIQSLQDTYKNLQVIDIFKTFRGHPGWFRDPVHSNRLGVGKLVLCNREAVTGQSPRPRRFGNQMTRHRQHSDREIKSKTQNNDNTNSGEQQQQNDTLVESKTHQPITMDVLYRLPK